MHIVTDSTAKSSFFKFRIRIVRISIQTTENDDTVEISTSMYDIQLLRKNWINLTVRKLFILLF